MSVNGKVIPHTPLAVDFWQVRKCPGTRLFFLSHMHSDHTVGLTSTWSNRPIYCSPTTATLLRLKLQVKEQWIHPLELSEPYMLPLDDIGKERLVVTLLDANHCPGAVMFLFEGYFGSILYTGDFRYTPTMLREPCLRTNTTIDVLYLDGTNCDPNRILPSRQRATQQIKEIIRSHPNHNVVIGLYSLGKESLLLELAMEFKTWIEVSFERMETLKALELPDVFTTDPGAGRIRVVDQSAICSATFQQWNKEQPTLGILPTSRPLVSFHPNVHVVPYSDHSSYQELEDFVSALKPASLIPIAGKCVPGSLSALLPSKKHHEFLVPESVQLYMLRQPENQLSSSTYASLRHRHFRPLTPKGVIFESPVRASSRSCEGLWGAECLEQDASEEEMDTESSEKDCILIDISKKLTPNINRRGAGDMWSLDIVQTVSEDMVLAESVPLSQLTQNSFAPVEILTNTKACLKPVRTIRRPFETNAKIINETASSGNYNSQQSRHGNVENNYTLSDDIMRQPSGHGIDQDDDMRSDDNNTSQHGGCENDQDSSVRSLQNSPDSSNSSSFLTEEEYLEELENIILKSLPFTEEDFKPWGLLQQSSVQQFPLCPLNDAKEDDISGN
ncbi:5' exonuclease Apollo [Toxotes jaculatrix]|uniref:5' exonuclease Apollo n=1 Tax=Toxotes jaculatrix TaxID=941984 RepID=UPI001B3AAB35|nr:5' exonuclease Apollo [Toxotes jaculatrix]XP_040922482.1 5' exonuclease Apollo [Toxotes jaculatrix]XP_040922493.1 5' exonuclease Apollo [Toxotes jaculatrix]